MTWTTEGLLVLAQAFLDRKYIAKADDRQRAMGLAYIEAERQDLAKEVVRFIESIRDAERDPEKFSKDAIAAYADVVSQGDAIYRQEQNDIQDRRAIRTFVDRFRALAALA